MFSGSAYAGAFDYRFSGPFFKGVGLLGGEAQHRLKKSYFRFSYFKLSRVNADGKPADAGVEIISVKRALSVRIKASVGVKRKRGGRDDGSGL
ncbi:hypothetical protein SDC9_140982 [bioreactor metagenome]|uniref:Uncharacterized protein n=1 Tax=bioreactor metagenome TaxID=1076179 RepID=A0A645DWF2_9ZZZZ